MLHEFHRSNNAIIAYRNICSVYSNSLDVSKCQWFERFRKISTFWSWESLSSR